MGKYQRFVFSVFLIFFVLLIPGFPAYADKDLVIVIDPGHGGQNLGAEYNHYTEKEMTMTVAKAMKAELEKYEGVTVYLTHESADTDMTLKERADFAVSKNADFLYCLHFNMSADHNLFGAEVWTSAFGEYYARGQAFGQIEMELLSEMGLYSRGVKTRLNESGEDYYGIIRESLAIGLDTVLIEHCHLDGERDQPYYTGGDSQLEAFGRLDAKAVARYFQLWSEELQSDYSDYPRPTVGVPSAAVKPDLTPPDVCTLELVTLKEEIGEAVFTLKAEDYESRILYTSYSVDGGKTYGETLSFPEDEKEQTLTLTLPLEEEIQVCARAYNAYDRITESNRIEIAPLPDLSASLPEGGWEVKEEKENIQRISLETQIQKMEEEEQQGIQGYQMVIAALIGLMILVAVILTYRIASQILTKAGKQTNIITKGK